MHRVSSKFIINNHTLEHVVHLIDLKCDRHWKYDDSMEGKL